MSYGTSLHVTVACPRLHTRVELTSQLQAFEFLFSEPLARIQVAEGPFPWPSPTKAGKKGETVPALTPTPLSATSRKRPRQPWRDGVDKALVQELPELLEQIDAHENVTLRIPRHVATSGGALKHSIQAMEDLFDHFNPMIFKFGFTHNPIWRWENSKYGYIWEKDKWTAMVVLYLSREPWGPAMLEAALIEKYRSALTAVN